MLGERPYNRSGELVALQVRYTLRLEKELSKGLDWASIGASWAGKRQGTKKPSPLLHKGGFSAVKPPILDKDGNHRRDANGELMYGLSEKEMYEGKYNAEYPIYVADGVYTARGLGPGILPESKTDHGPLVKGWLPVPSPRDRIVEALHAEGEHVEARRLGRYTSNAGEANVSQRGRGGLHSGRGVPTGPVAQILMQKSHVEQLEREFAAAKGSFKKEIRGKLWGARKRLEEMEYLYANRGLNGRLKEFEDRAARSTRGRAQAEKIKQDGGRKDYN